MRLTALRLSALPRRHAAPSLRSFSSAASWGSSDANPLPKPPPATHPNVELDLTFPAAAGENPAAAAAAVPLENFAERVAALVDDQVVIELETAVPADVQEPHEYEAMPMPDGNVASVPLEALPHVLPVAMAMAAQATQEPRVAHVPGTRPVPPDRYAKLTEEDFMSVETYRASMVPPHEAYTVTPASYMSQAFFDVETQRVFGKSWVCIGSAQDVRQPGDTIVSDIGGQPIFAVRDKSGNLNGFYNVCRHRGSKLVRKAGRHPVISCSYHRWGYALDGRLLATPLWDTVEGGDKIDKATGARKEAVKRGKKRRKAADGSVERTDEEAAAWVAEAEAAAIASASIAAAVTSGSDKVAAAAAEAAFGADAVSTPAAQAAGCSQIRSVMDAYDTAHITNFKKDDFALFKVRVQEWGCLVFATLGTEEEVPPLETALGDVPSQLANYPLSELVRVRSKRYESKANWKLLAENFMEYLHLPSVHPALCNVSAVDDHHRRQGPGQYVGFVTSPLTNGGTPIDPRVLTAFPGLEKDELMTGVFHQLFPNVFYFLLPSHIFLVRLDPQSPTLTVEHAEMLVHPSLIQEYEGREEELDAKLDAMFDFYDMTNLEDIEACELVQEGVKSMPYRGGRVSFRFEETIHRFQQMLISHMIGNPGQVPKGDADIPYYIATERPLDAIGMVENYENNTVVGTDTAAF